MPTTRSVVNVAEGPSAGCNPSSSTVAMMAMAKPQSIAAQKLSGGRCSKSSLDGLGKMDKVKVKADKRTAFGDITNAGAPLAKMKRGLSNMVSTKKKPATAVSALTIKTKGEVSKVPADDIVNDLADGSSSDGRPQKGPRRLLPPPDVEDFDLENWNDVFQCSEYAMDIFRYYKSRETQFQCPDYMSQQPHINETMRSILVDWMVEVQESFELNHETLYLAVKMMDLYLSRTTVQKDELQLIGATACLIACKIDERIPPLLDDFVYVCDDAYDKRQIKAKEREMICAVDFDVGYPLSYKFLRRYARVCKVTMPVLTLARYFLEVSLSSYRFNVNISESKLAAAALVLALKTRRIQGWTSTLRFYSGYSVDELAQMVKDLLHMLKHLPRDAVRTIRQKYSHKIFHQVALIELPDEIDFNTDNS